uniref:IMP dehydrogenase/GMP reductase, putative n=1 Tax=Medicago truncatula TaxID=3880 RepID=A2Q634_MEDTR|nr:IMP dehydrogenase/GMP reductase, putative [Medicago truncatula]
MENYLVAARWKLQKGHGEGVTYRSLLDRIQFDDVCWRPYEEHREIQDFEEVFWYSGWIMCGVRTVYRHLPEWAFVDFRTHTLKAADWGEQAGEQTWRMADGYVLWYTRVSHPQILPPIPGDLSRPANEEQIIAEQWERYEARSSPDTYDMHDPSAVVSGHEPYEGADRADFDQEARPEAEEEAPSAGPGP